MLSDDLVARIWGPARWEQDAQRAHLRRLRLRALVEYEFPKIPEHTTDIFVEVLFQSTIPLTQAAAYHVVKRLAVRLAEVERGHLLRVLSAAYQDRIRGSDDDVATEADWTAWMRGLG